MERPIDESNDLRLPELDGEILAIFHARFTRGVKSDAIFSHPFMTSTNAATLFLAHNGGLLSDVLEGSPYKVDSEWALEQVMARGGLEPALPVLKEHTRSALNLLVLTLGREKETSPRLEYFHFFKPKEPAKVAYYTMFEGTMPGGRALVSSTLTFPAAKPGKLANIQPAVFDKVIALNVGKGSPSSET